MTFVYSNPKYYKRNTLQELLGRISMDIQDPWVLMGDFNAYTSLIEKKKRKKKGKRGGLLNQSSMKKFRDFINKSNMIDMGFQGPKFPWK